MKHKMTQEFEKMELQQLQQHIEDSRRALFSLRLSTATSHVKDSSQFKKLRRNIARGLTILQEKQEMQFLKELQELFKTKEQNND